MDFILILMMFIPSALLFIMVLILSILLVVSSPSWLGAWVGLELNLISFIPVVLVRGGLSGVERRIKYFLVQAFSSLLILVSILIRLEFINLIWFRYASSVLVLIVAFLIKLGAAPFHFWFPSVASGIGWLQNFILITLQKIGPLILVRYVWGLTPLLIILIVLNSVIGGLGGLNQRSLRKLLAYSSINHLAWLMASSYVGFKLMIIYFGVYIFTSFGLISFIHCGGYFYLSQIYYYIRSNTEGLIILLGWFSFGGLPPFIGFFGKWVVINVLVDLGLPLVCTLIVFMRLVSLFYYTRVCYVILSQPGGASYLPSCNKSLGWVRYFMFMWVVVGLVLVPIFVLVL